MAKEIIMGTEGTPLLVKTTKEKPVCRVLHVFSGLSVGGAETWLMALLRHLREAPEDLPFRLQIDVCLTGGRREFFDDEAEALGVRLFYVPFARNKAASFTRRFRKILREGRYQAIHNHQDLVAGLHFLSGASLLPPIRIAHVHNNLFDREKYYKSSLRRLSRLLSARLLAFYATHILGTSRQLLTEYGFDDSTFAHLQVGAAHCGFDTEAFRGDARAAHRDLCHEFGWENDAKIILFVGRIDSSAFIYQGRPMSQKNPAFALDVAKGCIDRDASVRMLLAGHGAGKREELEAQVNAWNLSDKIRFLGVRSDIPRLMLGSNLLLFPSVAEGLGMVTVEAQAAGVPVLASDTTPRECVVIPEMVEFMSLVDSTAAWSETALRLLRRPRADALACNLRVKSSPFSIENSAARLVQIYTSPRR